MQIRILSEHPHLAAKCGEVVEVDADATIEALIAAGYFELAEAPTEPPAAEPAQKTKRAG